jgi:hypothetical protein
MNHLKNGLFMGEKILVNSLILIKFFALLGSSSSNGRGRQQQAAVHYPNPKETKVSMYKRLKRFGSWIRKTASEKDCALIVLV